MAEKRLDYRDPPLPVNIASWKQADYAQMGYANEVAERWRRTKESKESFDADVDGLAPEKWRESQRRATALRIEQAQQQARDVCARTGEGSLECAQAWERANQAVEGIIREAALRPQVPYTPPEPVIEACPAGKVHWYREQMAEIQQAYTWALEHDPDRIPEIAASMNHLAEEAAADGCKDVMIAVRVEGRRMTEIAWDIQVRKSVGCGVPAAAGLYGAGD